jgi:Fe-S cluster assembly protein SufD
MKSKLITLSGNNLIKVVEDMQYVLAFPDLAAGKKFNVELIFEKPGVNAEIIGAYKLVGDETLDLVTGSKHVAPNTSCVTYIRGVLNDKAVSNYVGKIFIDKKGSQTNAYLHDNVLVLGDKTRNSSKPILEIEANDVKASHGAATGRINEEKIYYLMSRGLNQKEAEDLIVKGFLENILDKITDASVREKAVEAVR